MANPPQMTAQVLTGDGQKVVDNGQLVLQPYGSGGTPMMVRTFGITFATASLSSGVTIYTPAVGDVIYDIGIGISTAFDGTTPKLDVGTFNGGNNGLFKTLAQNAVDGTKVYADATSNAGLGVPNAALWLSTAIVQGNSASLSSLASNEIVVSAANPLLVVASQTGAKGGTAITSTHGIATIYVMTSTPISF